jgi:hypothetical protein
MVELTDVNVRWSIANRVFDPAIFIFTDIEPELFAILTVLQFNNSAI